MRRLLITTFTLLSTLILIATSCLWIRSHLVRDYAWAFLPYPADTQGKRHLKLDLDTAAGQLDISWKIWSASERGQLRSRGGIGASDTYHRTFPDFSRAYAQSTPPTRWNTIGFKSYTGPTHTSLCFPYWFAALLTAIPPAAALVTRARRRQRKRNGTCPN